MRVFQKKHETVQKKYLKIVSEDFLMRDLYLIRHGKTKGNLEGRYIGTTDEPLCEEGKQSLMQMADAKKYPAVEALFVSPMLRCRESAKILFPKQSISVVSDLRECDLN